MVSIFMQALKEQISKKDTKLAEKDAHIQQLQVRQSGSYEDGICAFVFIHVHTFIVHVFLYIN